MEGIITDNSFVGFGEIETENQAVYKGSVSMELNAERIDEKLYSDRLEYTNIKSGEGRITYTNGDTLHVHWDVDGYIGEGRRHMGITQSGDSLYEEGTFRNGLLTGKGKKASYFGTVDNPKYAIYEGNFVKGLFNGAGKIKVYCLTMMSLVIL